MGARGPGSDEQRKAALKAEKLDRDFPWENHALSNSGKVIEFLEFLPITSGMLAGSKMKLLPDQKQWVREVYDDLDDDGLRKIRTAVKSEPRKNGKTGFIAGIVLCHLVGPMAIQRGQIASAASDREQAGLLFNELEAIIVEVPEFAARVNIQNFKKKITVLNMPEPVIPEKPSEPESPTERRMKIYQKDLRNYKSAVKNHKKLHERWEWRNIGRGTTYTAMSSDDKKAHGLNLSLVVYDELAQAPNDKLYHNLSTGMGGQAEPLMIVISTQAPDDMHILSELIDYGLLNDERREQESEDYDPTFHLYLKCAPEDTKDIFDEDVWYACNPALGIFRSLKDMRDKARKAKASPTFEATFRNLYLNQRIDAETRFVPKAKWVKGNDPVEIEKLKGRPCFGGLDLSARSDLTGLVLIFPPWKDDPYYRILVWAWTPKDSIKERADKDRAPYQVWVKQGHLIAVPGETINYGYVAIELGKIHKLFDIQAIAFDRWRMDLLCDKLEEEDVPFIVDPTEKDRIGPDDLILIKHGQGFKDMAPAVDEIEDLILNEKIKHGAHPVLMWNASNAIVTPDPAGNRKIDKSRARSRIDTFVALTMGASIASWFKRPKRKVVKRGLS